MTSPTNEIADSCKASVISRHEKLRDFLNTALEAAGIASTLHDESKEVFSLDTARLPDLIILDQHFQCDNTAEIINAFQSHPATDKAWIIVITPRSSEIPSFCHNVDRTTLSLITAPFGREEFAGHLKYVFKKLQITGFLPE